MVCHLVLPCQYVMLTERTCHNFTPWIRESVNQPIPTTKKTIAMTSSKMSLSKIGYPKIPHGRKQQKAEFSPFEMAIKGIPHVWTRPLLRVDLQCPSQEPVENPGDPHFCLPRAFSVSLRTSGVSCNLKNPPFQIRFGAKTVSRCNIWAQYGIVSCVGHLHCTSLVVRTFTDVKGKVGRRSSKTKLERPQPNVYVYKQVPSYRHISCHTLLLKIQF